MVVTTFGTSHGDPTYCRFNTSTLFETQGRAYLVDCGEPVSALMVRTGKPFDSLRAAFVTHIHGDHVGGLPNLIRLVVKYPRETPPLIVHVPEREVIAGLDHWLQATHVEWPSPKVDVRVMQEGLLFDDGVLKATALPTRHMEGLGKPSFAYLLEAEGKRVMVSGDLKGDFSDFPELGWEEPCDLCVCEVTHYDPAVAVPILAARPIRRMIFHHVHNPWHGDHGETRLREILAPLPFPFQIAHDGDVFEL